MTLAVSLKLVIQGLVLVGVLLGFAYGTHGQPLMPPAPEGIVPTEGVAPCSPLMGVQKRLFDTDPGGKGAFVEFRLFHPDTGPGPVFLVIVADTRGEARAYLALPGRSVLALTMETLMARYAAPCDIVNQITGSPS